jgi:hypothetical protein
VSLKYFSNQAQDESDEFDESFWPQAKLCPRAIACDQVIYTEIDTPLENQIRKI